jgi:hypothetical protein
MECRPPMAVPSRGVRTHLLDMFYTSERTNKLSH